jgi:SAM-dependent methyltransferase
VYPRYARRRAAEQALAGAVGRLEADVAHVRERHTEQIERLEDLARELILTAEALRRDIAEAHAEAAVATRLESQLQALPYMADSPFRVLRSPVGEVLGFGPDSELAHSASGYAGFEDIFRGPAARVSDSQRPYVTLVRDHQPVLDAGCGRGEFLALLRDEGVRASGVDGDAGMVARCRELGLQATLADVNEHLEGLEDGSVGAVFSAQLIEHLPYPELRRMLELARRKLRPDGLFIAETVNPHRVASLKTFWVDLTHQHPIFPEVALAACAIAGFSSAYVFAPGFASFEQARFESPAYAVVASAGGSPIVEEAP